MSVSLATVSCLLLAASASAYICSDFTNRQCCAATVFSTFRSGYLLATTGYAPQLAVPSHLVRIGQAGWGRVFFRIQSHRSQDTCTVGLTGRSDHYVLRYGSDPYTVHALRIPYADYNNCYVAQFDDDRFGCRLWVKDNASPRAVGRCLQGLARVCPGPLFTTWNQQCVRGCGFLQNQWTLGSGSSQQQISQQQVVQ